MTDTLEQRSIATFYINGEKTLWRVGWGLGEPVYHALEATRQFIKDELT